MVAIGPGTKVVCVRDWPWKDIYGKNCDGPAFGTHWIVDRCPYTTTFDSDFIIKKGPYLTLVGWEEKFFIFGIRNFRPIDDIDYGETKTVSKTKERVLQE